MKLKIIFTFLIIVGLIAGALYLIPNFPLNKAVTNNNSVKNIIISITPSLLPTPTQTKINATVSLFLDLNGNGVKDNNEESCVSCLNRALVCNNSNSTPSLSDIINVTLNGKGELQSDNIFNGYTCWAVFEERKIIVPQFTIMSNSSESNLEYPAKNIGTYLIGNNTDISNIFISGKNYIYTFDSLISVLQNKFDKKEPVYLKYMPDTSKPDSYFMQSVSIMLDKDGSVTGAANEYYMKVNWNFTETYYNTLDVSSYELII